MKKRMILSLFVVSFISVGIWLLFPLNTESGVLDVAPQENVVVARIPSYENLLVADNELPVSLTRVEVPANISGGCSSMNIQPGQQGPMCPITGCCTPDCSWVIMCCTSHYCKRWTWNPFWPPQCLLGVPCCLEWVTEYWCDCYPKTAIPSIVEH